MSDQSKYRLQAQIDALNLLLQDVYANMYSQQPQLIAPVKNGIINTVKFNWKLAPGATEADADHVLKMQPLVVEEIERFFGNVADVLADFQKRK